MVAEVVLVHRLEAELSRDGFPVRQWYENPTLRLVMRHPVQASYLDPILRPFSSQWLPWHLGRVRYFVELLQSGAHPAPIELDNHLSTPGPTLRYEGLVLVDGTHRLMAHCLLKLPTVAVSYSGIVAVLEYLKGDRRRFPYPR